MRSPVQTRYEDLPQEIPIFPLSGALLLPWGRLPLNIFEPRYLNMTLDALKSGRILGMIQPDYDKTPKDDAGKQFEPPVYSTGCAGRIASFEETEDGRLLIVLKGLLRFRVLEEVGAVGGYRRVRVAYDDFKTDLDPQIPFDFDRKGFLERLGPYLEAHAMPVGIEVLKGLTDTTLITSVAMICPFDPREKQALLEAPTLAGRAKILLALLQMGVFEAGAPDAPRQ